MPHTIKRACHLCEAICGLNIELEGNDILSIKGDPDDPLSQGHICPKAVALQDIHNDPDRLRGPVKRTDEGWLPVSWDDAFDEIATALAGTMAAHGNNAVGVYMGNPNVHNYGNLTHASQFLGPIRTQNRFSATSVDQLPHQLLSYWMYGHQLMVPIPDIDHTDFFLMLGANPMASNGSIMTVPNFPKRLRALQKRGGQLVVIDPRLTETAEKADQHLFIQPGSDAALLAAFVHIILRDNLAKPGRLAEFTDGLDEIKPLFETFTPTVAEQFTRISAAEIEKLCHDFCAAEKAVCYGRMGCSTQQFGTLCQWLIQVINLLTGNIDSVGGMLFPEPAVDMVQTPGGGMGKAGNFNRWQSRVSGQPEFSGEVPASCMTEEILTPGKDQIRAMISIAGNPVLSTPGGDQLDAALQSLDFMVSIDLYINETTQHAHFILPPTSPLEHDHYDLIFHHFAVRNTSKYSPAVFDKPDDAMHDWEIYCALGEKLCAKLGIEPRPTIPPHQIVDLGLQGGQYPLDLKTLQEQPSGVDLGPLKPTLPERLQTNNKRVNALPELIPAELKRLSESFSRPASDSLQLIGRRHVRSNNSWMHQYHRLIKGSDRCTLMIHPDDAASAGLQENSVAEVSSSAGSVALPVEISRTMMQGVVSIPHGYGHNYKNTRIGKAQENAGVSANNLVPAGAVDTLSGNAAVNGVAVQVRATD